MAGHSHTVLAQSALAGAASTASAVSVSASLVSTGTPIPHARLPGICDVPKAPYRHTFLEGCFLMRSWVGQMPYLSLLSVHTSLC
jgi:hypothetical protein